MLNNLKKRYGSWSEEDVPAVGVAFVNAGFAPIALIAVIGMVDIGIDIMG